MRRSMVTRNSLKNNFGQVMRCIDKSHLIANVVEIVGFVPYLIGISQRDAEQSLAAGFKGNDVLARREHDLSNRHHALLADGFPDDSECLLTDLSVRGNVIGIVQVQFVDLLPTGIGMTAD